MDNNEAKNNPLNQESENPYSTIASLEDRLKIISNLVVDRIIEDQQNTTLQRKQTK